MNDDPPRTRAARRRRAVPQRRRRLVATLGVIPDRHGPGRAEGCERARCRRAGASLAGRGAKQRGGNAGFVAPGSPTAFSRAVGDSRDRDPRCSGRLRSPPVWPDEGRLQMSLSTTDFDYVRNLVKGARRSSSRGKTYLVDSRLTPLVRKQHGVARRAGREAAQRALRRAVPLGDRGDDERDVVLPRRPPFEAFKKKILPEIMAKRSAERALTIWCGLLERPGAYSLAMLIRENFPELTAALCRSSTDLSDRDPRPREARRSRSRGEPRPARSDAGATSRARARVQWSMTTSAA